MPCRAARRAPACRSGVCRSPPSPEVSRHLAAFLRQHRERRARRRDASCPDAILFNGGALTPALHPRPAVRAAGELERRPARRSCSRASTSTSRWSRGAAYYGLVRRGLGVRIGGGARAPTTSAWRRPPTRRPTRSTRVCLVPRGMHEGEEVEITSPEFAVLANRR